MAAVSLSQPSLTRLAPPADRQPWPGHPRPARLHHRPLQLQVCLLPHRRSGRAVSRTEIEEYLRLIKLFVGLGISKVRLTGGEPLLRRGLVDMIKELAHCARSRGEPLDLALTTNGHLLDELAAPLKAAGLNRVTVSMDAVDAATFERITRVPGSFETCCAAFARRAPPV